MASTLRETFTVNLVSPGVYEAEPFFEGARQGNSLPIAYGGIALSQALYAGQSTIPTSDPPFHLYSVQGTFLGPASTDVPTTYSVTDIRTTRAFCTRQINASQRVTSPKTQRLETRTVLIALMDWHVLEPLSLVEYSKPPMYPGSYSSPGDLLTTNEFVRTNLTPKMVGVFERMFPLMLRFFDAKPCPSSMGTQNSFGLADGRKTTQDDLPITSRTNSNWCRTREKLEGARENTSAVGFYMDGALSFIPMTFSHRPLTSAAACSSLDFSLRFFAPVDLSQWHLLEHHTEAAGNARTFSVGRLWDERGKEIAQMSQSSILRPRPGEGIAAKL